MSKILNLTEMFMFSFILFVIYVIGNCNLGPRYLYFTWQWPGGKSSSHFSEKL